MEELLGGCVELKTEVELVGQWSNGWLRTGVGIGSNSMLDFVERRAVYALKL